MADKLIFQQGSLSALSKQAIQNGTLWFTTDEGAIYLDANGSRIRFGDYVIVDAIANLPENGHAYESALYYAKAENVLARWDDTAATWIQLNAAGLTQIKINGTGNVLSAARVTKDPDTGAKVLTFDTASVATSEGLEALQTRVSNLETRMTAVEKVAADNTTAINTLDGAVDTRIAAAKDEILGDAEDTANDVTVHGALAAAAAAQEKANDNASDIEDLDSVVSGHTTAITNLQNAVGENGSIDTRIEEAIEDIVGTSADAAGTVTIYGALASASAANTAAANAQAKADDNADDIEALEARVGANETDIDNLQAAVNTLNGGADTAGSVLNTVNTQIAAVVDGAPEAFDTLKEIADWIGSDETDTGAAKTLVNHGNRIAALESADEAQDTLITNLTTGLANANTAIENLNTSSSTAVNNLKTELMGDATAGTTLGSLQDAIEGNDTDISNLQKDLDAAEEAAEALTARVGQNETDISGLKTRVGANETAITALQAADTAIRSEFANADTALKNELLGDATVYNTLGKAEDAIQTNANNIEQIDTRLEDAEGQLTWKTFE